MLTERGTSTAPTGVITVADLLSRYAPEPTVGPEPATTPVSVGSLLRREGREPHATDRPAQARAVRQPYEDDDDTGPSTRRGPALRRSAIAAGVLLAAGSVLGAVTVMNTSSPSTGDVPRPTGGYPGQGILDPQQQEPAGAIPTVVDNTAQSDPLDPGTAAPTSWMSTAFPGGDGSDEGSSDLAPSAPPGSAVPPAGGTEPPQDVTIPPGTAEDTGTGSGGPAGDQGAGEQDSGSDQGAGERDSDDQGGNEQGGNDRGGDDQGGSGGSGQQEESGSDGVVGGTVEQLGGALPEPLGSPVRSLGQAVAGLL